MAFGQLVRSADIRLREWIESSKLEIGGRLPSERALARELEMQHYAINRAMARLIADGVVKRQGYKLFYNLSEEPDGQRGFSCDLVISHRSIFLGSYCRVARELGVELRLHTWESTEEAVSILRQLKAADCESVIFDPPFVASVSLWESATTRLVKLGIPVVCINHSAFGVSTVVGDVNRGLELIFDHFLELGHEQLAFLTISPWTPLSSEILLKWRRLCLKNQVEDSAERISLQSDSRFLPEDARRLANRFLKEWKKVTALAVFMEDEYAVQQLIDELTNLGISVPGQLSLAFVGDCRPLQGATPPVTAAAMDSAFVQETAFFVAGRAVRKKKEFGILHQACDVRIQPHLIRRESTASSVAPRRRRVAVKPPEDPPPIVPPMQFPDLAEKLEAIRRRPYDLTANVSEARFASIDISAHVNRPLNFRRGWLGDLPLKHFEPGRHILHGVPFDVLGGSRRSDCGAVVFRSLINTTGNSRKLPSTLRIDVHEKVAAIYFLHGCGYAKHLHQFATYTFYAGKRQLAEVPLIALGKPPPGVSASALNDTIAKANIQDWWPDYPHYEFPHARVVPLLENENPEAIHRHVFLYTLEWVNPSPKTLVTHFTIRSDIEQSTTLGVLAVSVFKPFER